MKTQNQQGLPAFFVILMLGAMARAAVPPTAHLESTVRVRVQAPSAHPIPRFITGKFCEHLGANIYNGMDAQILRNPTLADLPFGTGQTTPDGVTTFQYDREQIAREIRRQATPRGWPEPDIERMIEAYRDGLACGWTREGTREAVQVSPDSGSNGGRAQRIQVQAGRQGISQWTYLPLHRIREYEFEVYARSIGMTSLTVALYPAGAKEACASAAIEGLSSSWKVFKGSLRVPADMPADPAYRFSLVAGGAGQFVVGRVLLRPTDHINGADPDVVRLLKESRLPILRWPGGNFVSGYHWEDGVGPLEQRPTRPNYAWGGVETHYFGTDEFIAFCRAVGCEPMICVNAGNGTPEEAARWIEYCNGPVSSPMGARRAANGHPKPYGVRHWEVGNELWGRWQVHWTTASGYVDRYLQFAPAMRAADANLELYACGAPVFWGKAWNDTLINGTAAQLKTTTDHPLIGGTVSPTVEPLDVYRDFMAVPKELERRWTGLRQDMQKAGISDPHLAVTELQMFAHLGPKPEGNAPVRLTGENLVNPGTLAEALYDVLIYHAAIRLNPFVTMVTHSATVNHGGGLRKERERVYANPCYYAQAAFAEFGGATPVAVDVKAPEEQAPLVLPELKNATKECRYDAVDAMAAVAADGSLLISLVHRGSAGPIRVTVAWDDFPAAGQGEILTLSAAAPWAVNTLRQPEAVKPVRASLPVRDGKCEVALQPYSFVKVKIPRR